MLLCDVICDSTIRFVDAGNVVEVSPLSETSVLIRVFYDSCRSAYL